ncbi:MAG: Na/Pi cotransporter family protein [Lachnospiraceae bacterium]|nr:Na/Pi cotransporter family protein [Lachnospiraceae bacterium]
MSIYEIFSLLGGVGLFLYGMSTMSTGLGRAAGDKLRDILEKVTANKIMAVFVGILVTVLIQSSSATDMMVIGFVNSGLMGLTQAIAVIMGANIGTTVTAQITAFNLAQWTPLVLFIGVIMYTFLKQPRVRYIGMVILGFGMLFVGITMVKSAIAPLSQSSAFIGFLEGLSNPAIAVLFGVAFTALLQSSSSSVVIFQAFAAQGILEYDTAVYLVIGAAIGSVTPNLLAGLTTNRNGKRTAILNLIFNLFRAALLIILINVFPQILTLIQSLSPDNIGRQVANTHTAFAIIAVVAGIPLMNIFVSITKKLLPDLPEETELNEEKQLKYIVNTDALLPAVAVRQAVLETARLGHMANDNLVRAMSALRTHDEKMMKKVSVHEEIIDHLTDEISNSLIKLRTRQLTAKDSYKVGKLLLVISSFERIGDHADNILKYIIKLDETKAKLSETALVELEDLTYLTLETSEICLDIFENEDKSRIAEAEAAEQDVDDFERIIISNHAERLMRNECQPMAGIIFTDICTDLERVSDHALDAAFTIMNDESVSYAEKDAG